MQRLSERGSDTGMALGSDVMDVALEGCGLLNASGRNQRLDGLRVLGDDHALSAIGSAQR